MSAQALSDEAIAKVINGFETRRDGAMESLRGKPLVRRKIEPPLFKNQTIPLYRNYCYSLVDFAFKSLWLEDQVGEANQALIEFATAMDKPEVLLDGDGIIWVADEVCRIVEYWGVNGSRKKRLLSVETENALLKMMWGYASVQSRLATPLTAPDGAVYLPAETLTANLFDIEGSENIHLMRIYARWHFSALLKAHPDWALRAYEDGGTAATHHQAWARYQTLWLRERSTKGLFVEFANDDYNLHALKGILGLADFASDPALRRLARSFLDLYWATWAQEQLGGVRGGAKARVYRGVQSILAVQPLRKAAWLYLGVGETPALGENLFSFAASAYRLPPVVVDLALDIAGRGQYEITQRCLGLAGDGLHSPPQYRIRQDDGLVRLSYVTPDFVMGAFYCEALREEAWAMVSSQNRWAGVVFAGDTLARVFPQAHTEYRAYNNFWCLQSKGALIVQKLPEGHSKYGGPMRVYFSDNGLSRAVDQGGWAFAAEPKAWVAVRPAQGAYTWTPVEEKYNGKTLWKGRWLVPQEEQTPVIIEVARQADFATFEAFQEKILSRSLEIQGESIVYQSASGDRLEFYGDLSRPGKVNGREIDRAPAFSYRSPFVNAAWGSGKVGIEKGARRLELDFSGN